MGKKSSVQTMIVEDPYKIKVSNPLSNFLSSQVSKGLPGYTQSTGKSLSEPLDTKAYNTYQDFLGINPSEWYNKAVVAPTMRDMKEQNNLISEGWAGSLRGSGRFRDVEDFTRDTSSRLAEGRYKAELEIPQAQFGMAQSYSEQRNKEKMLEYQDWFKSLPEMNPNLDRALQFLAGPSGRDVISYMDPGKKKGKGAAFGSIAGMVGLGIASLLIPGAGIGLMGLTGLQTSLLGGAAGGAIGSMFD